MDLLIRSKRNNIHEVAFYMVIELEKDENYETAINGEKFDIIGKYKTSEESYDGMKNTQFKDVKEYTIYLNENRMHYPNNSNSRTIFCYITDELTSEPGIYSLNLYEFNLLKGIYPSFRLANLEEMKSVNVQHLNRNVIKISNEKVNEFRLKINGIVLINVAFLTEDATPDMVEQYSNILEKGISKTIESAEYLFDSDSTSRIQAIRNMNPNMSEQDVIKYAQQIEEVMKICDDQKNEGKSINEIMSIFYNKLQLTNNIDLPD